CQLRARPLSRKISTPSALLSGGSAAASLRNIARDVTLRGTLMNATSNSQTAAEQGRKNYCDVTTQLGQLGLDNSVPEAVRAIAEKSVAQTPRILCGQDAHRGRRHGSG